MHWRCRPHGCTLIIDYRFLAGFGSRMRFSFWLWLVRVGSLRTQGFCLAQPRAFHTGLNGLSFGGHGGLWCWCLGLFTDGISLWCLGFLLFHLADRPHGAYPVVVVFGVVEKCVTRLRHQAKRLAVFPLERGVHQFDEGVVLVNPDPSLLAALIKDGFRSEAVVGKTRRPAKQNHALVVHANIRVPELGPLLEIIGKRQEQLTHRPAEFNRRGLVEYKLVALFLLGCGLPS